MRHADAIKKLMPLDLGVEDNAHIAIEGSFYDKVNRDITQLQKELFPRFADALIEMWEFEYGIVPPNGATLADRLAALQFFYTPRVSITANFLKTFAAHCGFDIDVVEVGERWKPFRVGLSKLGEPLYESSVMWQVRITIKNSTRSVSFEDTIKNLLPPHLNIVFDWNG